MPARFFKIALTFPRSIERGRVAVGESRDCHQFAVHVNDMAGIESRTTSNGDHDD